MPQTIQSLPVTGTVAADSNGTMLVLSERLEGHNTFLTGQLEVGATPRMTVRIMTLDDVTVLRLVSPSTLSLAGPWTGILHLAHGWRTRSMPPDLAGAAVTARRDLGVLDEAELRYALTFLGESSTDAIRRARIRAIVDSLPGLDAA
jgi:hypothetical protein